MKKTAQYGHTTLKCILRTESSTRRQKKTAQKGHCVIRVYVDDRKINKKIEEDNPTRTLQQ